MAKKNHTVVQTSPLGRPGDVVKLDPEDEQVQVYARKGLVVEGKEDVQVPLPTSVPDVEPETKPARKPRAKPADD